MSNSSVCPLFRGKVIFYQIKHDFKNFEKSLAEAEKLNDKAYSILILNSIKAFSIDRNPLEALHYLKKAKGVSKGDYTWLYNKAFIYMYLEKFDLGLKNYKKLRNISFANEESTVNQCIAFNENLLQEEPNKKQSLFILGYLYYTKKNNFPIALEKFEQFIQETKNIKKYDYLRTRAKTYIGEIKKEMQLDEDDKNKT